jgi:chromosome segregation ATPase
MKKYLILTLILMAAYSFAIVDVPPSSDFYDSVTFLVNHQIMSVDANGFFSPNEPIDRAHLAIALYNAIHYLETTLPKGGISVSSGASSKDISVINTKLNDLQNKVRSVTSQLNKLSPNFDSLSTEVSNLKQSLSQLQSSGNIPQKVEDLNKKVEDLKTMLTDLVFQLQGPNGESVQKRLQFLDSVSDDLNVLKKAYYSFDMKLNSLLVLNSSIDLLNKNYNDLNNKFAKYQQTIDDMKSITDFFAGDKAKEFTSDIKTLKINVTDLQNQLQTVEYNMGIYGNKIKEISNELSSYKQNFADLNSKINSLSNQITMVASNSLKESDMSIIKSEILNANSTTKSELQYYVDKKLSKLENLTKLSTADVLNSSPLIKNMSKEFNSLGNELSKLKQQVQVLNDANSKITQLNIDSNKLNDVDALSQDNSTKIQKLSDKVSSLDNKINLVMMLSIGGIVTSLVILMMK